MQCLMHALCSLMQSFYTLMAHSSALVKNHLDVFVRSLMLHKDPIKFRGLMRTRTRIKFSIENNLMPPYARPIVLPECEQLPYAALCGFV